MFTPEYREALRTELIEMGQRDPRVTGVAITGSASADQEDRWSDIDLAFGVAENVGPVLDDFTAHMYERHHAVHRLDVHSGNWLYRVFLLANTLQVDLALAPEADFGARAPTFKLVSGKSAEGQHPSPPKAEDLFAWGWLYALHARSSIARAKPWQAEYMISGMRDQVLALACLRHGLPSREGRGIDRLPTTLTGPLQETLLSSLEPQELLRAFRATMEALINEAGQVDKDLASRLDGTLRELTSLP